MLLSGINMNKKNIFMKVYIDIFYQIMNDLLSFFS